MSGHSNLHRGLGIVIFQPHPLHRVLLVRRGWVWHKVGTSSLHYRCFPTTLCPHRHKPKHSSLPPTAHLDLLSMNRPTAFRKLISLFRLYSLSWVCSVRVGPTVWILWKQDGAVERALHLESGNLTYSCSCHWCVELWHLSFLFFLWIMETKCLLCLWFVGLLEDQMSSFNVYKSTWQVTKHHTRKCIMMMMFKPNSSSSHQNELLQPNFFFYVES